MKTLALVYHLNIAGYKLDQKKYYSSTSLSKNDYFKWHILFKKECTVHILLYIL